MTTSRPAPYSPAYDFASDPAAEGKVNTAALQAEFERIAVQSSALDTALEVVQKRADASLADGSIRLRNLSAEVKNALAGLTYLEDVKCAAGNDIALSGLQVVDGYQLVDGDRILLFGQAAADENRIYVAAAGAWGLAADELVEGESAVAVVEGTAYALSRFLYQTTNAWVEIEGRAARLTSNQLADASVTTIKIADLNVTTGKLADLSITTGKLADLSVTTAKMAAGAVTTAKLAAGAVTATEIGAGAVTSAKLAASPALTGTPTAPTAAPGTNTTQIATTAFVTAAVAGGSFPVVTTQEVSASVTISAGRVKFTGSTPGQILGLPAGSTGTEIHIRNASTVKVTVATNGLETIEGAGTFDLDPDESLTLCYITSDWTVF